MIYSVSGKVTVMEPNLAVVECGGVGYACRTTATTLSQIAMGEQTTLLTYLNVREDSVELFGFADKSELNCFRMLTSVSGVGPKAALSILSEMTPQGFALCVVSGDSKSLTRAQGVGAKIAQRIVLELKDKLDKENKNMSAADFAAATSFVTPAGNNAAEAITALMVLGFSNAEATGALSGISPDEPVAEMIKQALRRLGGK